MPREKSKLLPETQTRWIMPPAPTTPPAGEQGVRPLKPVPPAEQDANVSFWNEAPHLPWKKVVLQPPVLACLPDPVPTGRRGLLLASPATLSASGKQKVGRRPAEAVGAWGWGNAWS